MAKKGVSKCKECGIEVPTDEAITYSNKKYCKSCGEAKKQEGQDYKDLIAKVCEYLQIDIPTPLVQKQIKEYREQYNYTCAGMSYSLWYAKEVKGMTFEEKYGIAILKYMYKEAEEYFLQQQRVQESVVAMSKVEEKVREIKVSVRKQDRKPLLLNLDDLIGEGDS